jgi:ABC-type multidrug transport system fused ATPase/permease subunit
LFIDEATSSLDPSTEKGVQRGLQIALGGNLSAIIVTHRLPTVRHLCNKFLMLDKAPDGHGCTIIAEASSFEELAEKCPEFRVLAADQDIVL